MLRNIIVLSLFAWLAFSCESQPELNYKYAEKDDPFKCPDENITLVKEALYAFEDYILQHYDFKNMGTLSSCYSDFLINSGNDFIPMAERLDEHMKNIFYELEKQEELWTKSNGQIKLNYNSNLVTCMINNIQDQQTKNVLDALMQTKSLRASTVAPVFKRNAPILTKDKALASFVALDLFYAKLVDLDLSLSPEELAAQIREINSQRAGHVH